MKDVKKKRILIIGEKSYIGLSFRDWLNQWADQYEVNMISVRENGWEKYNFSGYDSVLNTVGIAHIKEKKSNQSSYYEINCDLATEIAKKAKESNVQHYVFISSMSVFGKENGQIDNCSNPQPKTHYGKSKEKAERLLEELKDDSFKIAVIRPPIVYGKNCKGNYAKLSKLARITPIFPKVNNKRSMIYIDNLSECMRIIIDMRLDGFFHPQNCDYVSTSEMVQAIAETHGKNILQVRVPFLKLYKKGVMNKLFSDLFYEGFENTNTLDYIVVKDFKSSILQSEN